VARKINYHEIEKAVKILDLPERATLRQIKACFKKMILKWHPDQCQEDQIKCKEMSQKIIDAYNVLLDYCNNYEYSFKKEDIQKKKTYEELWAEQFGNDPIWGNPKK